MARGPFQGNWQQGSRPTVVTAPDALVYINGRPDLTACPNCRRRFDLNKYVTSVQVDLSVENAPGSASFNLSVPLHAVDDFFVDGKPIVTAMMEVEVYAKGYYLVAGMPQYYPIFWGLITDVSDNYASGEHTVSISCADILKWWELSRMNINAAFTQAAGQMGRDYVTGNVYHGANVYDIIWTLAQQSVGDIVQAQGSLISSPKESKFPGTFDALRSDIMSYWNARFGQMRSNLMLYGMEGAAVRGDSIYASQPRGSRPQGQKVASTAVRTANGGDSSSPARFDPSSYVMAFRSNIANSGNPNLWQSEFQTKLEIANTAKEAIGFEFFMDVTGDIVFKPPFYNLDVLSNKPISWLQDIDIIDWNISESESEVITQLQMSGSYEGGAMDVGATTEETTPVIQVTDYHLLRQYGWRVQSVNAEYLRDQESMFYAGLDMLDRINCRRHRATVTIPMRPELRLGFPVYLAPKDEVWYVTGISHNLSFGGRAQTQLTLSARRGKFIAPKGIGTIEHTKMVRPKTKTGSKEKAKSESTPLVVRTKPTARELGEFGEFKVHIGLGAETPPTNQQVARLNQDPYEPLVMRHPKTGRIVGYPNVNMVYTRPYNPDAKTFALNAGQNTSNKTKIAPTQKPRNEAAAKANRELVESSLVQNQARDLSDKHLDNRYIYGMTSAGIYTYVYEKPHEGRPRVLQEIVQLPIKRIEVSSDTGASLAEHEGTATIRPVSDERGFEVIGHHLYGRGVALRDGSLVLNNGGPNTRASVDLQLALAGGLFQTLQQQSHGLTAVTAAGYSNPADAVARMTPGDLETALNPETPTPTFMGTGQNFVDTAPLGSPANRGLPVSVEVSQLSRALTIAEMGTKDNGLPDTKCACVFGRSELAFMNTGYQVEFLKGTAPDNSSAVRQELLEKVQAVNDAIAAVPSQLEIAVHDPEVAGDPSAIAGAREKIVAHERRLREQLGLLEKALDENRVSGEEDPVAAALANLDVGSPVNTPTTFDLRQTMSSVDRFLQNLYEVLSGPHQEHEKNLRGDLTSGPTREAIVSSNENQPAPSPFSPPFSVSSRAIGGDPAALALQGSTAVSDIARSWKDFGDNLRRQPQRAVLTRQIELSKESLRRLTEEENRLEAIRDSKSRLARPGVAVNPANLQARGSLTVVDVSARLESLQEERAKLTQQLENAELKLQQLEATP